MRFKLIEQEEYFTVEGPPRHLCLPLILWARSYDSEGSYIFEFMDSYGNSQWTFSLEEDAILFSLMFSGID